MKSSYIFKMFALSCYFFYLFPLLLRLESHYITENCNTAGRDGRHKLPAPGLQNLSTAPAYNEERRQNACSLKCQSKSHIWRQSYNSVNVSLKALTMTAFCLVGSGTKREILVTREEERCLETILLAVFENRPVIDELSKSLRVK